MTFLAKNANVRGMTGLPIPNPSQLRDLRTHRVVVSMSGGKDSVAAALHMGDRGFLGGAYHLHMDTGWEHPDTEAYLRDVIAPRFPLTTVRSEVGGMEDWVREKGILPTPKNKWCTEVLKVRPSHLWADNLQQETGARVVMVVGIRAEESSKRANQPEWDVTPFIHAPERWMWTWRPLIRWSEQDVIEAHRSHGLEPNPLYLKGMRRVGCWPCINARKAEIRAVAEWTPERGARVEAMETFVTERVNADRLSKGQVPVEAMTLFQLRVRKPDEEKVKGVKTPNRPVPWAEVADWSKTNVRTGLELPPVSDTDGCMRWGMCETPKDEA